MTMTAPDLDAILVLADAVIADPRRRYTVPADAILGLCQCLVALAEEPVRSCRVCGCTHYRACIDEQGEPCGWVEDDLCSACAGREPEAPTTNARLAAAIAAVVARWDTWSDRPDPDIYAFFTPGSAEFGKAFKTLKTVFEEEFPPHGQD